MSDLRLVVLQTRYQLIGTMRNRRAVLFSLLLPAVLLVMFNSVFAAGAGTVDARAASGWPRTRTSRAGCSPTRCCCPPSASSRSGW